MEVEVKGEAESYIRSVKKNKTNVTGVTQIIKRDVSSVRSDEGKLGGSVPFVYGLSSEKG